MRRSRVTVPLAVMLAVGVLLLAGLGCRRIGRVPGTNTPVPVKTGATTKIASPVPVQPLLTIAPGTVQPGHTVPAASAIKLGAGIEIQDLGEWCSRMQEYGSEYSWITLSWRRIEPEKGRYSFEQFDRWVEGFQTCGQEVAVHILADASWAIRPPPTPPRGIRHTTSMPPSNMQDYYDFVYTTASHYRGKIMRYSIENEAHAAQNWGGTQEEYIELLKTGYEAVKAADPEALVEDAGMSSGVFGILTAYDIYKSGRQEEAKGFLRDYLAHYFIAGVEGGMDTSAEGLIKAIEQEPNLVPPGLAWANLIFQNHAYYDRLQVHYYAPWQDLPIVTDWIHKKQAEAGASKPLDFLEMAYGWEGAPGNGFDPNVQARDLVKSIVIALGEGADRIVQFQFNDYAVSAGQPGLFDSNGNARPAATSYRTTSAKLTGAVGKERLTLGDGIWGYSFSKAGKQIFVVWSTSDTNVQLPFAGSATITEINGETTRISSGTVPVSPSPVFVEPE